MYSLKMAQLNTKIYSRQFFTILFVFGLVWVHIEAPPPFKGRKQIGPCIGMDCLHGILMHGDKKLGDDHKHEDIYEKLQEEDSLRGHDIGPNQDDILLGKDKEKIEKMEQEEPGVEVHHKIGPNDAMTELHGVLMHGDKELGVNHNHEHRKIAKEENETKPITGPSPDDLHGLLMHGDMEFGHDHSEEDKKLQEPDPKEEGVPGVVDLDAALQGDFEARIEELGKPTPKDAGDFEKWKKVKKPKPPKAPKAPKAQKAPKNPVTDEKKKKKDTGGWTFPFITDSILNELDIMKRRYLKKFWGSGDEDVAYKEKDLRLEKKVKHDIADDIAAVGDTGPIDHSHNHGTTEPEVTSGERPKKDL